MKAVIGLVCFASAITLIAAQFPNGRVLEPPNPALCAQRVIHERAPDNKGYVKYLMNLIYLKNS